MRKLATLLVLALASTCSLIAATFTTSQDGPWSDPNTWVGGIVPAMDYSAPWPGNDVVIAHQVTHSGDLTTVQESSITVQSGGTLDVDGDLIMNNYNPAHLLVEDGGTLFANTLDITGYTLTVEIFGTLSVDDFSMGSTIDPVLIVGTLNVANSLSIDGAGQLIFDGATVDVGNTTNMGSSALITISGRAIVQLASITQTGDADILGEGDGGVLDFTSVSLENSSTIIQCVDNTCNYRGGAGGRVPTEAIDLLTGQAAILPVELLTFEVYKVARGAKLSWQTATESANDYFLLEYSADGRDFSELSRFKGAGYSQEVQDYSYQHAQIGAGTHYYRLWQFDFDGSYEMLGVRQLKVRGAGLRSVALYPNPAPVGSTLTLPQTVEEVQLYNSAGLLMADLPTINQVLQLPTSLPTGIYYLRWQEDGQTLTNRLVISNY